MAEHFTRRLGTHGRRTYELTIRVSPSFDHVEDFAVVVHYDPSDSTDNEVQIARIDTTHGYTHFDRLYRRDQPKERIDVNVWEASELLEDNWRTYAESYENLRR